MNDQLSPVLTYFSVPGPPKGVKAVVKSPRSVIVSWLEPELPNGVIERYHIYLRSETFLNVSEVTRYLYRYHGDRIGPWA